MILVIDEQVGDYNDGSTKEEPNKKLGSLIKKQKNKKGILNYKVSKEK